MQTLRICFNGFFIILGLAATSCSSTSGPVPGGKEGAMLYIFVESASRDPDLTRRLEWHRTSPQEAFVEREPVMQPLSVLSKALIHDSKAGGQVAELQFNRRGKHLLEAMTIEQRGRRLFFVAWYLQNKDDKNVTARCVGVHALRQVNADGRLFFTPDLPAVEAVRLIASFNKTAKALQR
tara:strand:+ start:4569 stop:5108 length:540 start_codon:yes stop_codon:yes gene_type:complete